MAKRTPRNSTDSMIKAMVEAGLPPLKPPKHVKIRKEDVPFWDGIVLARAREDWSSTDLVIAAQLARCQSDIEKHQTILDKEGPVLMNRRLTPVANPRASYLERLQVRQLAIMRALKMGTAAAGNPADEAARRKALELSRKVSSEVDAEEESLFA